MQARGLLKKIHIYLGLLNLSMLMVWGITGLHGALGGEEGPPRQATAPARLVDFTAPPSATDRQVAAAVYQLLRPPLASPLPDYAIGRDTQGRLRLDFYSVNGVLRVTVREAEQKLLVETYRNSFARFLDALHATTTAGESPSLALRLWALYAELSIWSLLAMTLTGAVLWLLSRPGHRMAWAASALGLASFVLLYRWVT